MRTGIVVQARMSSARLPGKVLKPLAGKPVLAWLLERLMDVNLSDEKAPGSMIVVATSRAPEDDAVEALARSLGVGCYRGSLNDVAARLADAAQDAGFEAFVRANGDSPLLDAALIEQAYGSYTKGDCDLVTNVFPRSFPKGMSVELIKLAAVRRILESTDDLQDREHVTRFAYANPARFRILNFSAPRPRPELQLAIDTPEDFARIEACVLRLGHRVVRAGWEEIANCIEESTSAPTRN
jgi:spore coat polysaccharide biosynthesis protein SpsF